MGSTEVKRQVALVAASVAAAAGLLAVGPAGATADGGEGSFSGAGTSGVCGWFGEELSDRFETVNVCAYDGVAVVDGQPQAHLAQPLVLVERYVCFFDQDGCEGEHHEIPVDRDDFVLDPLLRRARITTTAAGCAVEVEFAGQSAATPQGGLSGYHELIGGPSVYLQAEETLSRPAQWWGTVCGRFLVAASGEGRMWRHLAAGAGHHPFGGDGAGEGEA